MSASDDGPKLHIDTDWKAQAQAEKERLARREQEREEKEKDRPRTGPDGLPPADFKSLVGVLASQAVMSLGGYADPESGRVMVDLAGARFGIDLLGVLESRTKGNISSEESEELRQVIAELRARFVQFAQMLAQQQAAAAAGAAGAPGAPAAGGTAPGVIIEP